MGSHWPLTVDSGFLSCRGAGEVFFTTLTGNTYAVNGLAESLSPDPHIDHIWSDSKGPGPKKYLGYLLDRGLALCD
jgi:hypothetical protein